MRDMNDVISLARGRRVEETLIGTSEQLDRTASRPHDKMTVADL